MFGTPGERVWGWQFAGHHVSLNFTVADGRHLPYPVHAGRRARVLGLLAPLADDEELGFRLVNSLDAAQRRAAIIHHRPPPDLAARMVPRIGETERPDPVFAPEPDYVISDDERDILSYVRSSPKGVPVSALSGRSSTRSRNWSGGSPGGCPTRWPGRSSTSWNAWAWTT